MSLDWSLELAEEASCPISNSLRWIPTNLVVHMLTQIHLVLRNLMMGLALPKSDALKFKEQATGENLGPQSTCMFSQISTETETGHVYPH